MEQLNLIEYFFIVIFLLSLIRLLFSKTQTRNTKTVDMLIISLCIAYYCLKIMLN